jgi:hypothetical protein
MYLNNPHCLITKFALKFQAGERLAKELPTVVGNFLIDSKKFSHVSFAFASEAVKLVYEPLIDVFNKYAKCDREKQS